MTDDTLGFDVASVLKPGIKTTTGLCLGSLYTIDGNDVWEVISYCNQPTVTMRNVRTNDERSGAVGCPLLSEFMLLRPAGPLAKTGTGLPT